MNILSYSNNALLYEDKLSTYFADNKLDNGKNIIDEVLKNNSIWMANPSNFNDPFDCKIPISQINPTNTSLTIEGLNTMYLEGVGIRCFVRDDKKNENDQLMWSHYADKGNGICLVFNPAKDPTFFLEEDVICVEYDDKPLPLKINDNIQNWTEQDSNFIKTKCYSFGIKSTQWKYEHEIRVIKELCPMLLYLKESIQSVGLKAHGEIYKLFKAKVEQFFQSNSNICNCVFKKEALVEIRFGHNVSKERIKKIKEILQKEGYTHVTCMKSKPNAQKFIIEYENI